MKKSVYISRKVLNQHDLIKWATEQGFTSMLPKDDLHITVVYCKKEVEWDDISRDEPEMLLVQEDERHVHQFDGGATVLEIKSDELTERSETLRALGIHSSFPDYRAHVTITYDFPEGLNIEDIIPYDGVIVLGPEIVKEITSDWKPDREAETKLSKKDLLKEESLYDFDTDHLYDIFKSSYDAATGQSWSKEQFLSRARNWTFYGDETGFVAFREQASGMRKLVGVAGETKGIVKGLMRLKDDNKPTWGAVSAKLVVAAKRYGFIAPHTFLGGPIVIRTIMASIPTSVFGGFKPEVGKDGGVVIDVAEVGSQKKFFIANKPYYAELLHNPSFKEHVKNSVVLKFIKSVLT